MQRLLLGHAVVFWGCLAMPVFAQDAAGCFDRGVAKAQKHEYDEAIAEFTKAIGLFDPSEIVNIALTYNQRGNAWCSKGDYEKAVADYNQALAINPKFALAFGTRGLAFYKNKEYDKAIADYNQFLRLVDPQKRGLVCGAHVGRGAAWNQKGDYDNAIADYNQALAIDPNRFDAYTSRGLAWLEKGEHDKAMTDYNQAIAINPKFADSYNGRGNVWWAKGEYDKAIADFNQALALSPSDFHAYASLATLYATCAEEKYRSGRKAFENASKSYQLTHGKDCRCIAALAAAYAECGDFEQAKEWQVKAIEMATANKDKEDGRSRLELYKQRKPYREEPNPDTANEKGVTSRRAP